MGLSKSRFTKGMQCHKALWLYTHRKELATPMDAAARKRCEDGTAVGRIALELHPDGVEVTEKHYEYEQALKTTKRVLEQDPTAIFEGAFRGGGVFVRPDILVRVGPGEYDIYEVKSSSEAKKHHVEDVGVQTYALEQAGLRVRNSYLMHIASDYVCQGGDYEAGRLLTATDLTDQVRGFVPEVPGLIAEMTAMLEGECPDTRMGSHCKNPHPCDFAEHCSEGLPDYPVTKLCFVREPLLGNLFDAGILCVKDIPLDFPRLQDRQRLVVEVAKTGKVKVMGDLAAALGEIQYPIYYLDFESVSSPLPLYPGTRPYQQVVFQWSCHVRREPGGGLQHYEFLHEETSGPRRPFAESMLELLGDEGSIIVHHQSFECGRIEELAVEYPDLATKLLALLPRIVDMEKVILKHVRHPDFFGKTSLKWVLPALSTGCSYDGLPIADGMAATLAYRRVLEEDLTEVEAWKIFDELRVYCGVDTEAMVWIHDALAELAVVHAPEASVD